MSARKQFAVAESVIKRCLEIAAWKIHGGNKQDRF